MKKTVALLADFNDNGDSWLSGAIVRSHNSLLG
jgi:hypothetical protein